ncbi:hypothetical protein ACFL35_04150 [Candidatus Riflebacteria bacterium]
MNNNAKNNNSEIYFILSLTFIYWLGFFCLSPIGSFDKNFAGVTFSSATYMAPIDERSSYVFVKSIIEDGDLIFNNDLNYLIIERNHRGLTSAFIHTIGLSAIWLPGYLTAKLLTFSFNIFFNDRIPNNGDTFMYMLATYLTSFIVGFLGLLSSFLLFRKFCNPLLALGLSLNCLFASPLIFYTFVRNRKQHCYEYGFLFLSLYCLEKACAEKEKEVKFYFFAAIIFLLTLSSLSFSCVYTLLLPLLYLYRSPQIYKNIRQALLKNTIQFFLLLLLFFSPGFIVLNYLNDSVNPFSTLKGNNNLPLDKSSNAMEPWHINLLSFIKNLFIAPTKAVASGSFLSKLQWLFFGRDWGLFFTNPLLFFGIFLPLIYAWNKKSPTELLFYLFIIIPIIIDAGFYSSWSYSHRFFIAATPFIFLFLARVFNRNNKIVPYIIMLFTILLMLWQMFLLGQYRLNLPYDHPKYVLAAFKKLTYKKNWTHVFSRMNSSFHYLFEAQTKREFSNYKFLFFPGISLIMAVFLIFMLHLIVVKKRLLLLSNCCIFIYIIWLFFCLFAYCNSPDPLSMTTKKYLHKFNFFRGVIWKSPTTAKESFNFFNSYFADAFAGMYFNFLKQYTTTPDKDNKLLLKQLDRIEQFKAQKNLPEMALLKAIRYELKGNIEKSLQFALQSYEQGNILAVLFLKKLGRTRPDLLQLINTYLFVRHLNYYDLLNLHLIRGPVTLEKIFANL